MWRLSFLLLFAAHSTHLAAQGFTPPEVGKTVDESFRVVLRQKLPSDCISWRIQGADLHVVVAVDKKYVQERAERADLAFIKQEAQGLLRIATGRPKGSTGCVELPDEEVLGYAGVFESGVATSNAVVLDGRSNEAMPYAVVRYFGEAGFGGHITYAVPGQRPFRANPWWRR